MQPAQQVRTTSAKFVDDLIDTGIPFAKLERAFEKSSMGRFNKVYREYRGDDETPVGQVAINLSKLCGKKGIRDDKYKLIKPVFERKAAAMAAARV